MLTTLLAALLPVKSFVKRREGQNKKANGKRSTQIFYIPCFILPSLNSLEKARRCRNSCSTIKKRERKQAGALFCFAFLLYCREQRDVSNTPVWYDTFVSPLFDTTSANMQAHLSNALENQVQLFEDQSFFQFFPTDQLTASLGLPVGKPKFLNLSSGNTQKPPRSDISFQSQTKREGKREKRKECKCSK